MFFMLMGGNYFRLDGKCFRYGHSAFPYVAMRERMEGMKQASTFTTAHPPTAIAAPP
jgi:hypothetical protein